MGSRRVSKNTAERTQYSRKRNTRKKNTRKKNTRKKNPRKKNPRKKNSRKKNTRKNNSKKILRGGQDIVTPSQDMIPRKYIVLRDSTVRLGPEKKDKKSGQIHKKGQQIDVVEEKINIDKQVVVRTTTPPEGWIKVQASSIPYRDNLKLISEPLLDPNEKVAEILNEYKAEMSRLATESNVPLDKLEEGNATDLLGNEKGLEYEKLKFEAAAVSISSPLMITSIMTSSDKNMGSILSGAGKILTYGGAVIAGAVAGPVAAAITKGITGFLVKVTEEIYKDISSSDVGKARKIASESSPKEDHRVMISLMVNALMPKTLDPSFFQNLCRLWVTGAIIINRDWFSKGPQSGFEDRDPRSKPSTAEKEMYDRIWAVCKAFISLSGSEWNVIRERVGGDPTQMTEASRALLILQASNETESDPLSIKASLGKGVATVLGGMLGNVIDTSAYATEKAALKGLGEAFKDKLDPDILSKLEGLTIEDANDFVTGVISRSPCSEVGCEVNDTIKTAGGSTGTIVDVKILPPEFKGVIDQGKGDEHNVYVAFNPDSIKEPQRVATHKVTIDGNDKYIYSYTSDELTNVGKFSDTALAWAKETTLW